MAKSQKTFFMASFLPALAYYWLESRYPLPIALGGGLILSVLEILFEKWFSGKVHTLSRINFFLILFLGGIALIGQEGIWFKLQPAFSGAILGSFFLWQYLKEKSIFEEMLKDLNRPAPPKEVLRFFEKGLIFFFYIYGSWMAYVAIYLSTGKWIFFKTIGLYITFFLFTIVQVLLVRRKLKFGNRP